MESINQTMKRAAEGSVDPDLIREPESDGSLGLCTWVCLNGVLGPKSHSGKSVPFLRPGDCIARRFGRGHFESEVLSGVYRYSLLHCYGVVAPVGWASG